MSLYWDMQTTLVMVFSIIYLLELHTILYNFTIDAVFYQVVNVL